ncbi:hypothetical protein [Yersinia aleksiciae]|uniref:hypothetical protein n=1 Tax=Yersinia aleksiciae TaxID=263819 RepID=UPI0011A2106A|nr:hypothetical protein [Yersinia aleksiciae]
MAHESESKKSAFTAEGKEKSGKSVEGDHQGVAVKVNKLHQWGAEKIFKFLSEITSPSETTGAELSS